MNSLVDLAIDLHGAFLKHLRPKTSIFLVGASRNRKTSLRYRLGEELPIAKINVYYPEVLFDEQLSQRRLNLLEMENLLAAGVDAVVICPESSGSFTELGAFSNHPTLNQKLIVIQNSAYKNKKSFVNIGPIKYLETKTKSKVIWHDYDVTDFSKLIGKIKQIIKEIDVDTKKSLKNISIMEQFILILFYVFGETSKNNTELLINETLNKTGQNELFLLACALLDFHIRSGYLKRSGDLYDITPKGRKLLFEQSNKINPQSLDSFRIRALTLIVRRKVKFEEQIVNS